MFLDVESTPPLSLSYYRGWAQTLSEHSQSYSKGAVTILPCVYGVQSDNTTWQAVASASEQGVACHGVWIARWKWRGCQAVPEWNDAAISPTVALPCKILLWQYSDECHGGDGFDCNQTNPAWTSMLLSANLFCPPRWPSPKAPNLVVVLLAAALPLVLAGERAEAGQPCTMIAMRQAEARVHVELSASKPERAYCIRARMGQRLLAEISNASGVAPSGRVISPSGKMNGGPGGPFFRGKCGESGIYRIEAGQRGPKRAGSYDLTIALTPPR